MTSIASHSADRADHRMCHLLFFLTGGIRFATEASSVQDIAGAEWSPQPTKHPDKEGGLVDIATLLSLPEGGRTRTLVIETDRGPWGFGVEAIPQGHIEIHQVTPVPPLLRDWMSPCVLTGFYRDHDEVSAVLDLRHLARVAAQENRPMSGMDTGRKP